MVQITAEQAMEDLTMALLYLSRFKEGRDFGAQNLYRAWKGYDFDVLNELEEKDFIYQGSHRAKSVSLFDEWLKRGKEILERYGISDWKKDE